MPAPPVRVPMFPLRPLMFLDFEASSLSDGSWPIEIGYAWFADGRVETRAILIEPRADWSMAEWSEDAARVHGLSLADVRGGAPAAAVAAETDVFTHFDVVSDNPAWEQRWLDCLRAGSERRIEVTSLRAAMRARLDEAEASAITRALFRTEAPHRAGPDAARLAQAWLGATQGYASRAA